MPLLELAEEHRHDDRGRAGRGADRELAGEPPAASAATSSSICSSSWSRRWAPRKRRSPASVGSTRRPERSSSCVPSRFSSARTCSETAGCVTPSRSAACEKLRRSTTAQNAASWRVSISEAYRCSDWQITVGVHEGLDRHDEFAARAVLPAADRAARGARPRRSGVGARLRPDARAARDAGIEHAVVGPPHGGAGRAGKIARDGLAAARAPRVGRGRSASTSRSRTPRTSFRSRPARCGCRPRTRTTTSSPARSTRSARGRRPGSSCRTRSRRSGSTGSARRRAKVRRYPGLKEEYYLAGLRARRDGARPARARPLTRARRRAHAARGLALPPARQPALHRRARAARPRRCRAGGRPAAHAGAARHAARRGAAVARRARARGRRAEPRRARRPRRLGRRDDEPRGRRARDTRLDDVRRAGWARSTRG